jgi:hypothetical protein
MRAMGTLAPLSTNKTHMVVCAIVLCVTERRCPACLAMSRAEAGLGGEASL